MPVLIDLSISEDGGESQHVLSHRPVAHRGRARRACRRHPADGRVGAGIDRKHQPGVAQRFRELQAGHAGLDRDVEILGADPEDAVEFARSIEMPPRIAWTWPSSEVPAPNGTTGNWKAG